MLKIQFITFFGGIIKILSSVQLLEKIVFLSQLDGEKFFIQDLNIFFCLPSADFLQSLYQVMKNNQQQSNKNTHPSKQERRSILRINSISERSQSNITPSNPPQNERHIQHEGNIFSEIQKSGFTDDDLNNMNMNKIQQFTDAWKSQSNFSILLIEKLSLIVNNYFKMLTEITQRNQEIEILIIYNKSLIEILNKFEDQQKKIIQKLRVLEDFNLKIMKELCALKKRQFDPPQIKPEQSIFVKFSLRNFKYEPPKKQQDKLDEKYQQKIELLFKQYLLEKTDHYIPMVEAKLKQQQTLYKQKQESNAESLKLQSNIEQLHQLLVNLITYNKQLDHVTSENMFDLYELKWEIRNQMKLLNLEVNDEDNNARERMFVNDVRKIYAGLNNMNQGELQNYLNKEKQIRKKMKKQRVKEQEVFLRACEQAQNQNIELKQDIKKLKERVIHAEDQLSNTRAKIQFKNMKQNRISRSNIVLDQSIFHYNQGENNALKKNQEQKKLKENFERLSKIVEEVEFEKLLHDKQKESMASMLNQHHIEAEQNMKCSDMMKLVLAGYEKLKQELETKKLATLLEIKDENEDDSIKPITKNQEMEEWRSQKSELSKKLQKQAEQLEKINAELEQKLKENIKNQSNYYKEINAKNERLKQLSRLLEAASQKEKRLSQSNRDLELYQKSAQNLAHKITEAVEVLVHEDFTAQNFLLVMDKMFENLKTHIEEYKRETKKEADFGTVEQYGEFQSQQIGKSQDNKKNKNKKLEEEFNKSGQTKEKDEQKSSNSIKSSKKSEDQKLIKQKNPLKQPIQPQRAPVLKKQFSMPHFSFNKQKFNPDQLLNDSLQSKNDDGQIKDSILFKVQQNSESDKFNKMFKKQKTEAYEAKRIEQKPSKSQKIQNSEKSEKSSRSQKIEKSQKNEKSEKSQKSDKMEKKQKNQQKLNQLEKIQKGQQSSIISEKRQKQKESQVSISPRMDNRKKKYQKLKAFKNSKDFQIKIESNLLEDMDKQRKSEELKNPSISNQDNQQSLGGSLKNAKSSSENNSNHRPIELMKKNLKMSEERGPRDQYFFRLNGILNPNPLLHASNQSSIKERQSEHSHTKFHPSSFLTSSEKNKGEQNSFILKSQKNSQNAEKSGNSSRPHLHSVNLTLSEDEVELEEELGITPHNHLQSLHRNTKTASQLQQLNKSAMDVGIELMLVDKMFEKFQRLRNDEDVLDFYELFQRYKQALKCLEKSEQLNKLHEIRYQKFIESVKNKQRADPSYNVETRLHFLQRHVLEQEQQLLQQKRQFESVFIQHIITSEKAINQHFKLMRKQNQTKPKVKL